MEMKERIKQKANDLYRRYGIRSVTMDEIAAQLGVSKKTIYQYYSDKDELVDAVAREMIGFARDNCDRNRSHSENAIHEIFQAMEFVGEMFNNMNAAMLFDLERFHPTSYKVFLEYKNKYLYSMIKSNLERGIEEGLYRPEIHIDIIAKLRLEGVMAAFNQELFPTNKYNLATLNQEIMEHFLFGVSSLKGHKLILKYQQERLKVN
jgi:TetR/AcrR family transcriptional regulator, cholesterol catabolism regulator